MDYFPVILINQFKGKTNPKKLERTLQGYYDFFENWVKRINSKNIQDCLNDKLFSSQPSDFPPSYIFYKLFEASLTQHQTSKNKIIMNFLKISFVFSLMEIEDIITQGLTSNFYSFYTLFKILDKIGEKKLAIFVLKIIFFQKNFNCFFDLATKLFWKEIKEDGLLVEYKELLPGLG